MEIVLRGSTNIIELFLWLFKCNYRATGQSKRVTQGVKETPRCGQHNNILVLTKLDKELQLNE